MINEVTISEADLEYYRARKCSEDGCYNFTEKGYILCEGHLHGFPERLPEEVIEILKKEEKSQ